MFPRLLIALIAACCLGAMPAQAGESPTLEVQDTYLDLRTGPGEGYPMVQIVERGEAITVLLRKTDWYKVRTRKGFEGWIHRNALARTLDPDGTLNLADQEDTGRWEVGAKVGDFEGSTLISGLVGYHFTPNLAAELTLSETLGDLSNDVLANISLLHQPWPHWRYSPYLTLGGGAVRIRPEAGAVPGHNRTDKTVHAGLGLRFYATRQFMVRGEYRSNIILNDVDDNLEIEEWTLGFSAFF